MQKINEEQIVKMNEWLQAYTQQKVKPMYGVRDIQSINSIVQSLTQQVFGQELYPTLFDKAAHLWYTLANYHCFYNGNKRTAVVATYVFLQANGYRLTVDASFYAFSIKIIEAHLTKEEIKEFIQKKSTQSENDIQLSVEESIAALPASLEEDKVFRDVIVQLSLT